MLGRQPYRLGARPAIVWGPALQPGTLPAGRNPDSVNQWLTR
jgi:hypothetical protein